MKASLFTSPLPNNTRTNYNNHHSKNVFHRHSHFHFGRRERRHQGASQPRLALHQACETVPPLAICGSQGTPPANFSIPISVQDFKNFWSALKSSEFVESQKETDVVKWTFNDGTVLEVKQEEHSVSGRKLLFSINAFRHLQFLTEIPTVYQPLHHLQHHHLAA